MFRTIYPPPSPALLENDVMHPPLYLIPPFTLTAQARKKVLSAQALASRNGRGISLEEAFSGGRTLVDCLQVGAHDCDKL